MEQEIHEQRMSSAFEQRKFKFLCRWTWFRVCRWIAANHSGCHYTKFRWSIINDDFYSTRHRISLMLYDSIERVCYDSPWLSKFGTMQSLWLLGTEILQTKKAACVERFEVKARAIYRIALERMAVQSFGSSFENSLNFTSFCNCDVTCITCENMKTNIS